MARNMDGVGRNRLYQREGLIGCIKMQKLLHQYNCWAVEYVCQLIGPPSPASPSYVLNSFFSVWLESSAIWFQPLQPQLQSVAVHTLLYSAATLWPCRWNHPLPKTYFIYGPLNSTSSFPPFSSFDFFFLHYNFVSNFQSGSRIMSGIILMFLFLLRFLGVPTSLIM